MRASLAVALLVLPVVGGAQTFRFNDKNGRDTVNFVLNAPFERINGLSNKLTGEVRVEKVEKDGEAQKVSGTFRLPVRSIKTGIELRDEHLTNDRWLDAANHPEIIFRFQDVKLSAPLEEGKELTLEVEGEFTIRGVTRKEKVQISATLFPESEQTKFRAPGDLLHVSAAFKIPIEAYGIKRTQALVLKVAEIANVTVDAWGSTKFQLPTAQAAKQ